MYKHILLLAVFLFAGTTIFAQTEKDYMEDMIHSERHSHENIINFRANPLTNNYDVKYHRFNWDVDPAVLFISGSVFTRFVVTGATMDQLHFDFSESLEVDSVIYNGQQLNSEEIGDDVLRIDLPSTLNRGDVAEIEVFYKGTPAGSGFGSFANSTHEGTPLLWTLSEPYGAKEWWPCKQDLNDKIDSVDVFVKVPVGNKVASNGLLLSSVEEGDFVTYHWSHKHKIPAYLIAIAVTNYEVYTQHIPYEGGNILVENYVYPEEVEWAQSQLENLPPIMQFYDSLFITYPYANEKYGHAHFGWGGGMEHTTITFMGGWSFLLQAHELAHHWFGDMITCGSWQDIWLNEGFATYLEGINYEHGNGLTDNNWQNWKQQKINHITSQPGGSVWVNDTTSVGRIFSSRLSYSKGSMLLHMLRWELGDEDFFQAIRNYLNDPDLAFGYARTSDLIAHLEAQSGKDLTEFFNDWFYGEGYPIYDIHWWQGDDGFVRVDIYQETSHPSVGFFEMKVPILFEGEGQSILKVFDNTEDAQHFVFPADFNIENITFDPDLWLVAEHSFTVDTKSLELASDGVKINPNPTSNLINIEMENDGIDFSSANIYNDSGSLIMNQAYSYGQQIDVSDLPKGTYWLELRGAEQYAIKAFVKI